MANGTNCWSLSLLTLSLLLWTARLAYLQPRLSHRLWTAAWHPRTAFPGSASEHRVMAAAAAASPWLGRCFTPGCIHPVASARTRQIPPCQRPPYWRDSPASPISMYPRAVSLELGIVLNCSSNVNNAGAFRVSSKLAPASDLQLVLSNNYICCSMYRVFCCLSLPTRAAASRAIPCNVAC